MEQVTMADSAVAKPLRKFQRLIMVIEEEQRLLAVLTLEKASMMELVNQFFSRSIFRDGNLLRLGAVRDVNEQFEFFHTYCQSVFE